MTDARPEHKGASSTSPAHIQKGLGYQGSLSSLWHTWMLCGVATKHLIYSAQTSMAAAPSAKLAATSLPNKVFGIFSFQAVAISNFYSLRRLYLPLLG